MPAKWIKCPDNNVIEIERCLSNGGCRMGKRCHAKPLLKRMCFDREWRGITASMAGNGARQIYLMAVTDYTIDPQDRIFAVLGVGVHSTLAQINYTFNTLPEEMTKDGTPDLLEEDEKKEGYYILTDYKTWGSYRVKRALGLISVDSQKIDDKGNPLFFKNGKPQTHKTILYDEKTVDLMDVSLQLNRYRIMYELQGYPVSSMGIEAIVRDGNTYMADSRGVPALKRIEIPRIDDDWILSYYHELEQSVHEAFRLGYAPVCGRWENWEGKRCEGYCNVLDACKEMSKEDKR